MIINYRALNDKNKYPLSQITETLDQLRGVKYFSIFNLASEFQRLIYQVLIQ